MIHVDLQPEPPNFDREVRRKGLAHLEKKEIPLDRALPPGTKIEPYWQACLDDLYKSYRGTCAYLGVFFERVTGGGTVDHFIAKSRKPAWAYEWANYRLACSRMNSLKRDYEDVLDPFEIENGWFCLELVMGRIYPSPDLDAVSTSRVQDTIERLNLDDPGAREMRARYFEEYARHEISADYLRRRSPFVWLEARRQGLL